MAVPSVSKNRWVIIDGINPKEDYSGLTNKLDTVAKLCNESNWDPILWVPQKDISDDPRYPEFIMEGFGFIAFGSSTDATSFRSRYHKHPLLAPLKLKAYVWDEISRLEKVPDTFEKMGRDPFLEKLNLKWWLTDDDCKDSYRDQFVMRFKDKIHTTQIYWMDERVRKEGKIASYDGSREAREGQALTLLYVDWSPKGGYLASFHRPGIKIWGNRNYEALQQFDHPFVDLLSFSPNESFVVTCNSSEHKTRQNATIEPKICIWDSMSGVMKREYPYSKIGPAIKFKHPGWWPLIKFSYDDQFFAKIDSDKKMAAKPKDVNIINIYDSHTCRRVQKFDSAHNMFMFEWSPNGNYLAYSTRAVPNDAAKVVVLKVHSEKDPTDPDGKRKIFKKLTEERVQILGFDGAQAHLYWQSRGEYLAVKIGHVENRKIKKHSIGILSVNVQGMPWTITEKVDRCSTFAWEPESDRFGILFNDNMGRVDCTFYRVKSSAQSYPLFTLTERKANGLYWAPRGGRCIIAHVDLERRGDNTILEFVDIAKGPSSAVQTNHEAANELSWCPSGRYALSSVTQRVDVATSGDDSGYMIWSFQGQRLFQSKQKFLYQMRWRPRPKFPITKKEAHLLVDSKRQEEYKSAFTAVDESIRKKFQSKYTRQMLDKKEAWKKVRAQWSEYTPQLAKQRYEIRGYTSEGEEDDYEVTDKKETVVESYREKKINKGILSRIQQGESISIADLEKEQTTEEEPQPPTGGGPQQYGGGGPPSPNRRPAGAWGRGPPTSRGF